MIFKYCTSLSVWHDYNFVNLNFYYFEGIRARKVTLCIICIHCYSFGKLVCITEVAVTFTIKVTVWGYPKIVTSSKTNHIIFTMFNSLQFILNLRMLRSVGKRKNESIIIFFPFTRSSWWSRPWYWRITSEEPSLLTRYKSYSWTLIITQYVKSLCTKAVLCSFV